MKIIITNQTYHPTVSGVAIVAQRLAANMAERGHEIYVFAPSDKGESYKRAEKALTEFRLHSFVNPVRKDHHISLFPYRKMSAIIEEIDPDVLHTHDPLNIGYYTGRIGKKLDIATIATVHALPEFLSSYFTDKLGINKLIENFAWWAGNRAATKCDLVITPSHWAANSILKRNPTLAAKVISNGVDTELFKPSISTIEKESFKDKLNISKEEKIIIYVGRLDKEKNLDVLIESLPHVNKEVKAKLVLVGNGSEAQRLKILVNNLGIGRSVLFKGEIPYEQLPDLYRASDLFAIPSAIENQSCVVLEASSSGLPIVAFGFGGMPEIVKNNINGILINPGDHSSFAKALITILKDLKLADKMGKESRRAAELHSLKNTYDEYERVYISAIH